MKLTQIQEIASISNIGAARDKRQERQEQSQRDTHDQMFARIDNVISATIDELINQHGMDQQAAEKAVHDHLGDIVMAYDIR